MKITKANVIDLCYTLFDKVKIEISLQLKIWTGL